MKRNLPLLVIVIATLTAVPQVNAGLFDWFKPGYWIKAGSSLDVGSLPGSTACFTYSKDAEGIERCQGFTVCEEPLQPEPTQQQYGQPNPAHVTQLLETGKCPGCQLQGLKYIEAVKAAIAAGKKVTEPTDLSDADLRGATFEYLPKDKPKTSRSLNINFSGAKLNGALFKNMLLFCDFTKANLRGARFEGSNFSGSKFYKRDNVPAFWCFPAYSVKYDHAVYDSTTQFNNWKTEKAQHEINRQILREFEARIQKDLQLSEPRLKELQKSMNISRWFARRDKIVGHGPFCDYPVYRDADDYYQED